MPSATASRRNTSVHQGPQTIQYLDYHPRGVCKDIFTFRGPEFCIAGPAGTGKSRAALEKAHFLLEKYSNIRGLMVRKTRKSLTQSAIVTYETKVLPHKNAVPFHGGQQEYQYSNGSIFAVAGMDDPQKVLSSEWDFIYANQMEELEADDWQALTTRNRNWQMPFQQSFGDANPGPPDHWIRARVSTGRMRMFESRHEDNPELFNGFCRVHNCIEPEWTCRGVEYLATLDALTGVLYKRLRKGIWAAAEGMVYEDVWDRSKHVIDRFTTSDLTKDQVPKSWPRIWVIDFGYKNPFVWQAWAVDPDGRLFRYKEIYHTKRTVAEHCDRIKEVTKDEPRPTKIITDHDAEDRATFEREMKMTTKGAWKFVSPGIQGVGARLKCSPHDGMPRLFYLRDSVVDIDPLLLSEHKPTCTENEYEVYVWDTGGGKKIKEVPLKLFDHGQDATRYLVAEVDELWKGYRSFFESPLIGRDDGDGREWTPGFRPDGGSTITPRFGGVDW